MTSAAYLSAKQAAAYVGVTYRGFDQFVRRHGVPCERYGRKRLFKREALERVFKTMALRSAR